MIKVHCRTNIDGLKGENWPEYFACRPMKGDSVRSESGAVLRIHDITHNRRQISYGVPLLGATEYEFILIIELHK